MEGFFGLNEFLEESEKQPPPQPRPQTSTITPKESKPTTAASTTSQKFSEENSQTLPLIKAILRDISTPGDKFLKDAPVDLLNFGGVGLAEILDRVLDKLRLRCDGSEGGLDTSLAIKLKTQNSVVTEISKKLQQTQKMLKDSINQTQLHEKKIAELEEKLIIKDIVDSQIEDGYHHQEPPLAQSWSSSKSSLSSASSSHTRSAHNSGRKSRCLSLTKNEYDNQVDEIVDNLKKREIMDYEGRDERFDHLNDMYSAPLRNESRSRVIINDQVHVIEEDNYYDDGAKVITKEMIKDAAKMIGAKKQYEYPSTLEIGLRTIGDIGSTISNPFNHLLKNPYQLEALSYRTKSKVPDIFHQGFNHKNHLSHVLSKQTTELLATQTPDQYIRVLHRQLQDILTALHDCIDALAEETRNTERWKLRFEKFKKETAKQFEPQQKKKQPTTNNNGPFSNFHSVNLKTIESSLKNRNKLIKNVLEHQQVQTQERKDRQQMRHNVEIDSGIVEGVEDESMDLVWHRELKKPVAFEIFKNQSLSRPKYVSESERYIKLNFDELI